MNRRKLGSTGLEVSEISFGAWQLGNNKEWDGMDDKTAHNLVSEAIDRGINLFDTAPNYSGGRSETLLGETLYGKRHQVVLVSKYGHRPNGGLNFSVDEFHASLDASLQRLKTDYLDVLLLHNPAAEMYQGQDPLWQALRDAQQQGKIRHYGASLDFASEIESCLKNTESQVLEVFFNILHQDVRRAFPIVREKGTGIIVKIPLDSGWLTGRFNAQNRFDGVRGRWSADEINQRAKLISSLDWLTADGSTLTQKALGYVLGYDEVSCVIPGMRSQKQLNENLTGVECVPTAEIRRKLENFWDEFTLNGTKLLPW